MQVNDMLNKIDFHDSNVIELFHGDDTVKLKVDLCMWKQVGYREGDDELKEISLVFDSIMDYVWDAEKAETDIDYDTILEITYNDGILKIVLQDDGISIITFKCNTVVLT